MRRILLAFVLLAATVSCTAGPIATQDRTGVAHTNAGDASGSDDSLPTIENAPPALEAIAHESRGLAITRAPAQRDVLAERLASTTILAVTVPLRTPTLGIVVPSCHPLLRWCVAHATATSPA